ncbi:glucose-6-phosphate dehydrogenase [uncultured Amnibacterium sp.]|uniref:glucose-6-phosphate dehydrogenase n=1 Tax=uncultured Amnibacterium sp. TaxID=1631851 RepID=UPI0035CA2034
MSDSTTLLILGASGDLTERLLLPGLGSLIAGGEQTDLDLLDGLTVIGSGRSEKSTEEWRGTVKTAFESTGAKGDLASRTIDAAEYVVADPTKQDDWRGLLQKVQGDLIVYFALPPSVVATVANVLADLDLPEHTELALEKPFGNDAEDAVHLNEQLAKVVSEQQIHRVDHFLGHRVVLATLALRFNNRLFEPVWNAESVERVEITYDEELGLEGRAGYYDTAGALRDMLQSHLLQVLSVVATEPPASIAEIDLRDATAAALRATALWSGDPVFPNTTAPSRRARYTAGEVAGRHFPDYASEEGVDADRGTETLAQIALEVRTARWAGVPFILRSGKAIGQPAASIVLTLRPVNHRPDGQTGDGQAERIVLGFKPPRVSLSLTAEGGSMPFELEPGTVDGDLPKSAVTEYGEVLRGVLGDDPTLSVRGDVAVQCWRIVQPVLDSWSKNEVPLEEYAAGTKGPASWT